jgi:membrane fusion protein, multidrug efflux system
MFIRKAKVLLTAAAVVTGLAAGAAAIAQSGIGKPKDGTGNPQQVDSPDWTYHILVSRNGEPPRKVAVVAMTGDTPIRVDAPGAFILFQPKRDGEPDRQGAAERRDGDFRAEVKDEKTGPSGAKSFRHYNDQEPGKIVLTSPKAIDLVIDQRYAAQIHSRRHIDVRALASGYLQQILVKEGQTVKAGDLLFSLSPGLYKANRDAQVAEVNLAQEEYDKAKKSDGEKKASINELQLLEKKLVRAKVKAEQAEVELRFTEIKAPFDGMVGRVNAQRGALLKEGDVLTSLSDNSAMWVYFNLPEAKYLEYMAERNEREKNRIDLLLEDGIHFPQPGTLGAIEGQFNNEPGNIAVRADFPNPKRLLRHGQRGTILLHQKMHDAIVIPTRATFVAPNNMAVFVVDKDDVAHQREIVVHSEVNDMSVIKKGIGVGDKIVIEGIRQIHDGEKVKCEYRSPEEVMGALKFRTE